MKGQGPEGTVKPRKDKWTIISSHLSLPSGSPYGSPHGNERSEWEWGGERRGYWHTESRHESRYLTVLLVSFTSYSLLTLVMSAHPTAYASLPLHYRFIMIDPSLLAKNLPRDQDVTRIDHVQNSTFHSFIGGPPGFTHHLTGVSHPS